MNYDIASCFFFFAMIFDYAAAFLMLLAYRHRQNIHERFVVTILLLIDAAACRYYFATLRLPLVRHVIYGYFQRMMPFRALMMLCREQHMARSAADRWRQRKSSYAYAPALRYASTAHAAEFRHTCYAVTPDVYAVDAACQMSSSYTMLPCAMPLRRYNSCAAPPCLRHVIFAIMLLRQRH